MSEYKCDCGKGLVEYNGKDEACTICPDTANWDFICEDENCGKRYAVEFRNIGHSSCTDCDGDLDDGESSENDISIDSITWPFDCSDCGTEHVLEYHPIDITPYNKEDK
ncbi:hypothetical protein DZF79_15580 [Vibrio parahaemolyticus]|nr:hypothetical protein [Vibrio parahaemolyticus]